MRRCVAHSCIRQLPTTSRDIAFTGSDGASVFDSKGRQVAARALRRPGTDIDLLRLLPGSVLPTCPSSSAPARPNVIMFNDGGVVTDIIDTQHSAFQSWLDAIPRTARVVIVEVGAGKAIPTIRHLSESVLRSRPSATLVRINLDDADVPPQLADRCISVGGAGALQALQGIAQEMERGD